MTNADGGPPTDDSPMERKRERPDEPKKASDRLSELFQVPAINAVIPRLTRVPETKEERWRRRIMIAIAAFIAVTSATTAIVITMKLRHEAAVRDAAVQVSDDGRTTSLERALELVEDDDSAEASALRARLLATSAIEHGRDRTQAAKEVLTSLDDDAKHLLNARIATTYLALARSDLSTARREAGTLVLAGPHAPEAARAQALAALAMGDTGSALASARAAAQERPDAPRHAALLALTAARAGNVAEALGGLTRAVKKADSPALHVARGRILLLQRRDFPGAASEAGVVLGKLADVATEGEKAWAHAILGRVAAERGETSVAVREARQAVAAMPRGDESFALLAAETFLRSASPDDAARLVGGLPRHGSFDAAWRAQVAAELAIEQDDSARADAALANATDSPWTFFLRARLHEMHAQYDAARQAYERAARDPRILIEAYTRLAALELRRGRPDQASAKADAVLARERFHRTTVPVAVRARLALGQPDAAMDLARRALAAFPNDPQLLGARAEVEMATGQWDTALETLRSATQLHRENADLQAALGDAARQRGRTDEARQAYLAALRLNEEHPVALVGMVELALTDGDLTKAREGLARVDEARVHTLEAEQARAKYLVRTNAGQAGIVTVRNAARDAENDPLLWRLLGELLMQAEDQGAAARSFYRSLEIQAEQPEALLDYALAQIVLRRPVPAGENIEAADQAGRARGLGRGFEARVLAAKGKLELAYKRTGPARTFARRALAADPRCAEAHVLLADVALSMDQDPSPHLRAAVESGGTLEAMARYAMVLEDPTRACDLARRYREAVPRGRYEEAMRRVLRNCR